MGEVRKKGSTHSRKRRRTNGKPQLSQRVRTFIALVVTVVWAGSIIADILSTNFSVSPALHAIMLAVVGVDVTEMAMNRVGGGGRG